MVSSVSSAAMRIASLCIVFGFFCSYGQYAPIIGEPSSIPQRGQCPGGPSLPIQCDPKRPWPACPPQSYCYATNSVDVGPYFCCPIWSTYGSLWRPSAPSYNYVPPMPTNWPNLIRSTATWPASSYGYQQQPAQTMASPYQQYQTVKAK